MPNAGENMDDKELQELYLQRNKLNSRIKELERVRLKEAREQNKDLVGRCFKDERSGSTTYLKIVSTITKYDSDKYDTYSSCGYGYFSGTFKGFVGTLYQLMYTPHKAESQITECRESRIHQYSQPYTPVMLESILGL